MFVGGGYVGNRLFLQFAKAAPAKPILLMAKFYDYKYNKGTTNKCYTFLRVLFKI
jgi:hypothetical protein